MSILAMLPIMLLAVGTAFGKDAIRLIATAREGGSTWKYLESDRRMTSWMGLTFNDKKWKSGSAGFGNRNNGGLTKTPWSGGQKDLYLRKEFKCDFKAKDIEKVELQYAIDDSVEIWLNGKPIFSMEYNGHYEYNTADVTEEFRRLVRESGRSNIVAVKAHDNGVECYVDVGLVVTVEVASGQDKKYVSKGRDSSSDREVGKSQNVTKSHRAGRALHAEEKTEGAAKNKTSTRLEDGLVELGKICDTEGLVHCWRFNGTLRDEVGGGEAQCYGNARIEEQRVTIFGGPGGESGSSVVLGSNLIPNEGSSVTIELWATQHNVEWFSRIFHFGDVNGSTIFMTWSCKTDINKCQINVWDSVNRYNVVGVPENFGFAPFDLETEYHIAMVLERCSEQSWKMKVYKQDAKTGETIKKVSIGAQEGWSLTGFESPQCYLGRGTREPAANASYNEVRIWNRALDEQELTQNAISFHKAGETMKTSGVPRRFVGGGNSSSGRETRQQSKLTPEDLKKIVDAENAYDKKMFERKFGNGGQR